MPIDSYAFGSMVVDGKAYTADLVLLPEGVRDNWWREKGHSLGVGDLQDVFAAEPEVLVVGTGAYGEAGASVVITGDVVEKTGDAVERYNGLLAEGRRVVGAFHLTC